MIRINLIRDRVERPPTLADRLSLALPVLLFAAYAGTFVLVFWLYSVVAHRVDVVQGRLDKQKGVIADLEAGRSAWKDEDRLRLAILQKTVGLCEQKWHWGVKLAVMQDVMPEEMTVTSFQGRSKDTMIIRAYTSDADGLAMERIRKLTGSLQQDELFMRGIGSVYWQKVENSDDTSRPGVMDFELKCVARP